MKCKACGHLIVVKGTHAAEAPPGKARGAHGAAEPTPSPVTVSVAPLGDEPLARAPAVPDVNPFVARPVSATSLGRHDAESRQGGTGSADLPAPPTEQYIDLVLDEESSGGEPAEAREREAPPRAAARRDGPGLEDPFADWKPPHPMRLPPEPSQAQAGAPQPRRETRPEAEPPSTPQQEGLNPKVLAIAGGVAVAAVAVLLVFYVGRGGKPPGPSAPVTAQPVPVAAPAPSPPPAPAELIPAVAEAEPVRDEEAPRRRAGPAPRKPKPVKVAREERWPEASPEPRPEPPRRATRPAPEPPPEPAPRSAAAPSAPTATPSATGAQPKAVGQLTSQQVARIVSANKRAFEQCIAEAGRRDPGLDLAGRQVTLMLTVNPNGKVAYPTIDDVELNKTDLGSCIKSAARIMMFPSFEGEPMKVEVPLSLGR
jgi:hypothetical protein